MHSFKTFASLGLLSLATLAACKPATTSDGNIKVADASSPAIASTLPAESTTSASTQTGATVALPLVRVHKSATCGCCELWVDHVRAAGFPVEVHDTEDLAAIKRSLGVPEAMASCHTAEVAGYFVEGHVPAQDIRRLLSDRPAARGLAVPGMPLGSPGMEMPDGRRQSYAVALIDGTGQARVFAEHR